MQGRSLLQPRSEYSIVAPTPCESSHTLLRRLTDESTMDGVRTPGAADAITAPPSPRSSFQISPIRKFQHSPLNHDVPSIRLVRILEATSRGERIKCQIRHTSIEDKYTCLSYVWGKQDAEEPIEINEGSFSIRRNLWDFLQTARLKPGICRQWLYIDALCIDQTNTIEQNHQVQQMGQVYSNASRVISWLGQSKTIEDFFSGILSETDGVFDKPGAYDFHEDEYWTRAWITQEFALAHRIVLLAGHTEIDRKRLPSSQRVWRWATRNFVTLFVTAQNDIHGHFKGRSIFFLLQRFRNKQCQHPRDRIFALLALSYEQSALRVDYGCSHPALAKHILRSCQGSFCLCAVSVLGDALKLKPDSSDGESERSVRYEPFAEVVLPVQSTRYGNAQNEFPCAHITRDITSVTASIVSHWLCFGSFQTDHLPSRPVSATEFHFTSRPTDPDEKIVLVSKSRTSKTKGCTLTMLEDGNACKLSFSFNALLVLAKTQLFEEEYHGYEVCCPWVQSLGTSNPSVKDTRILKLCAFESL
ncbi:heterokaryon incompatibility protein-domain-containing protein [Paraphoma chrysanthemicola]|nr:heterokaryon incompatibility protein-domain-containing protein [Paraphoma chrysanthemicola]